MTIEQSLADAVWHAEPPEWALTPEALTLRTGNETDFWQDTFYGFRRDDGHLLSIAAPPTFTATITFDGDYRVLYDQAGLMLRCDAGHWIKAGIEFSDGLLLFSTVVTRDGRSDWSVTAAPDGLAAHTVRLTRIGAAVLVHHQVADGGWRLMRVADFPDAPARIGPMACSPQRGGFEARFTEFAIGPPIDKPLHAD